MDSDAPGPDQFERLRAERDAWRRRAEVAEAVAAERLARAETAERALRAAEAALENLGPAEPGPAPAPVGARPVRPGATPPAGDPDGAETPEPVPPRPRSLLERWRRYTDTIN